jgi:hypothetical protein
LGQKSISKIIVILISFIFLLTYNSKAEDKIQSDSTSGFGGWASCGFGKCFAGPTGYFSFTLVYNNNIFNIRYMTADEFRFNPGGGNYDNPPLSTREIGVLYGRTYKEKFLLLSASAGLGYISGIDRGRKTAEHQYEKINISSFGIPLEAKFRLNMGIIGLGGGWFGNINKQKFLSGGMIEISVGVY